MKYEKRVFGNGIRAIVAPMKNTDAATLLVLVGAGSRCETKDIGGISHFLEHLFFKGTKSRPSPGQIAKVLDKIGAVYNAFTSKEFTGFWVKTASNDFNIGLDIVSDILLEPLFKKEEIERERGVIIQEKNMWEDVPQRRVGEILENVLYGDTPIGRDIIGNDQSIAKIQRDQIIKYLKNNYFGSNVVVAVAGNIESDIAFQKLSQAFRKMPKGKIKPREKADDFQKKPQIKLIEKKTDQMHFAIALRAYDMFDEKKYALGLLSTIFGGNLSSRLWLEIREKLGLAYYIGSGDEQYTDAGYLDIKAGVSHDSLQKVLEKAVEIIKKIKRLGISEKELKDAKSFTRGRFILGLESSDEVAMFYAGQELLLKRILQPEEILKKIEKVSKNDILKIEKEIFRADKCNLAAIGQHGDMKAKSDFYRKIINKI